MLSGVRVLVADDDPQLLETVCKGRAAGLATSVTVMTALPDPRIPVQVKSLGANAVFLRKPLRLSELEAAASALAANGNRHGRI